MKPVITVAGQANGSALLWSTDGINYNAASVTQGGSNVELSRYSFIENNGSYWLLGASGALASSSNGKDWSVLTTAIPSSVELSSAGWNGTAWVVVGRNGSIPYSARSVDGLSWTDVSGELRDMGKVKGTEIFVGIPGPLNPYTSQEGFSYIKLSDDGIGWSPSSSATSAVEALISSTPHATRSITVNDIEYNGSLWLATLVATFDSVSTTYTLSSPDADEWTLNPTINSAQLGKPTHLSWNNSRWLVGGFAGSNVLAYSSDGITWTPSPSILALTGAGSSGSIGGDTSDLIIGSNF